MFEIQRQKYRGIHKTEGIKKGKMRKGIKVVNRCIWVQNIIKLEMMFSLELKKVFGDCTYIIMM